MVSDSSTAVSHSDEVFNHNKHRATTDPLGVADPDYITSDVAPESSSSTDVGIPMRYRRRLILDTSSAPIRPFVPLTEQEKKLALMHRSSVEKRSIVPILYFLAASLGKLILGFGVSLAIKGKYSDNQSDFGIGLGLAIAGFIAVVAAALGFGAAASMINKRWGIIFKCFSIGGAIFISIGYALKQYFVSDDKPIFSIRLSFIPLALGTAMMGISLPNFTAYTELYRGRIVWFPIRHRHLIALLCLSPSMGILFGGWISAEVAHWPIAFNSAVLTFAVALGYAGVALFWSNHLRDRAELYDVLLIREEEELERVKKRDEEGKRVREKMGVDTSQDITRVQTVESL